MKHPVGYSRNGMFVYVDLIQSEAAKHISEKPHLLGLVVEALQRATLSGHEVIADYDLGRSIGYSLVVSTADADAVFYAQRVHEKAYTRFVKSGKPLATR